MLDFLFKIIVTLLDLSMCKSVCKTTWKCFILLINDIEILKDISFEPGFQKVSFQKKNVELHLCVQHYSTVPTTSLEIINMAHINVMKCTIFQLHKMGFKY